MITISLSAEDGQVIAEALQSHHDTLLLELSKADSLRFKEGLRQREAIVARVLDQLQGGVKTELGASSDAD